VVPEDFEDAVVSVVTSQPGRWLALLTDALRSDWEFEEAALLEALENSPRIESRAGYWLAVGPLPPRNRHSDLHTDLHEQLTKHPFSTAADLIASLAEGGWKHLTEALVNRELSSTMFPATSMTLYCPAPTWLARSRWTELHKPIAKRKRQIAKPLPAARKSRSEARKPRVTDFASETGHRQNVHMESREERAERWKQELAAAATQRSEQQSRPRAQSPAIGSTRTKPPVAPPAATVPSRDKALERQSSERGRPSAPPTVPPPAATSTSRNRPATARAVRFYRNDDLEQGTSEWLEWCRRVLGASDAPTIMGEDPWRSRKYLLAEKLGQKPEFKGNALTREGHALEGDARKLIEREFRISLEPTIVQSSVHAFLAASLDGIGASNRQIFEIKSGAKAYGHIRERGKVPAYYYGQLQHQMLVTGIHSMTFAVYRSSRPLLTLSIDWDEQYIQRLEAASIEFARELQRHGHKLAIAFLGTSVF